VNASYAVKPKADRDLDDYAGYLAEEASPEVALRFFDAAYTTFALAQPNMGWRSKVKYPGLETLRVFRVKGFEQMLILYRALPEGWTSCE
jgi:toxin ParE1/3/4